MRVGIKGNTVLVDIWNDGNMGSDLYHPNIAFEKTLDWLDSLNDHKISIRLNTGDNTLVLSVDGTYVDTLSNENFLTQYGNLYFGVDGIYDLADSFLTSLSIEETPQSSSLRVVQTNFNDSYLKPDEKTKANSLSYLASQMVKPISIGTCALSQDVTTKTELRKYIA